MKVLLVSLLGGFLWLTVVVLAAKYHVRHYRYLLRIARLAGYDKETVASTRAGQVAGAAVIIPLIICLALLTHDLTIQQHNGVSLVWFTLGLALTYAGLRGAKLGKRNRSATKDAARHRRC